MKIKSLLLGSAAALVAVTGARAADAIVVEAEPMEYVKVCDMYGAGYFYIPGTETCLKISGALRVLYESESRHSRDAEISDHDVNIRARLRFDAKNETQYGTLASTFRVENNYNDTVNHNDVVSTTEGHAGSSGFAFTDASISLAGFTVGMNTTSRYAIGWDNFHDDTAIYLDYTFSAGDLGLTVGIQDQNRSGSAGQPDIYASMSYAGEGYGIDGFVVYDTSAEELAYGVQGNVDLSSFIPGGKITAFWVADDGDYYDDPITGVTAIAGGNAGTDYVKGHQYGVRLDYRLTDSLTGFTRYTEHSSGQATGRTELVWAVASGLTLAGRYNKTYNANLADADGEWELELTRSF